MWAFSDLTFAAPRRSFWLGGLIVIAAQGVSAEEMSRSVKLLERAPASVVAPDPAKLVPSASDQASPDPTLPPLNPVNQSAAAAPALTSDPPARQPMTAPLIAPVPVFAAPGDDMASIKVANPAEISVEMLPGQTVNIGSRVTFRITSKKSGYLVLVDIDANGKLTQIYPNTAVLTRNPRPNTNYIKAGTPLLIPGASDPYGGIEYVISPPTGKAMIVAVLSEQSVQILDLPDIPEGVRGQAAALDYLTKWTGQLRIPENGSGQLREAKWSFDAKLYAIR